MSAPYGFIVIDKLQAVVGISDGIVHRIVHRVTDNQTRHRIFDFRSSASREKSKLNFVIKVADFCKNLWVYDDEICAIHKLIITGVDEYPTLLAHNLNLNLFTRLVRVANIPYGGTAGFDRTTELIFKR
jgi:hypothetical protein